MPISHRADQVYRALVTQGATDEQHMAHAEMIVGWVHMPKGLVMAGLDELVREGKAKRRHGQKSSGYWVLT